MSQYEKFSPFVSGPALNSSMRVNAVVPLTDARVLLTDASGPAYDLWLEGFCGDYTYFYCARVGFLGSIREGDEVRVEHQDCVRQPGHGEHGCMWLGAWRVPRWT